MKKIIEYIPLTTILIVYLYVCGGIYLLAYWGTFDFDIIGIVKFEDVIKSFVYPFLFAYAVFFMFCVAGSFNKQSDKNSKKNLHELKNYRWFSVINLLMILIFIVIIPAYTIFKYNFKYWLFVGVYFMIFSTIIFESSDLVVNKIPNAVLRFFVVCTMFLMPATCVILAKAISLSIYNNGKIKIVNIHNTNNTQTITATQDTTHLKLLGFLGDKFIVSSLDNKKIIVLNQSAYNEIELEKR